MQKKLIALAIAGLSSVAFAQTNVTVYGVMDASIDVINIGDATDTLANAIAGGAPIAVSGRNETQINSNNSYLGFKGAEDLGNGLKAIFQIESGIGADGTTGTWNSRNTFVGLTGGFGTVMLGNYDTPYKTATRSLDPFADHIADNRNIMGQSFSNSLLSALTGVSLTSFDARQGSQVLYQSPDMSGFGFAGAYAHLTEGIAATSGSKADAAWSLNGTYANGPWYAAVAYARHNAGSAAEASSGGVISSDDTEHAWKIGGGWKQDAFRVGLVVERTDADMPGVATALGMNNNFERTAWTLGGGYTFSNMEFKLAYTRTGDLGDIKDSGAKQWAAGLDYTLSKRTMVYGQYVKLSNENNGFYGLNGAGTTATTMGGLMNSDPSAFSLGIRHSF